MFPVWSLCNPMLLLKLKEHRKMTSKISVELFYCLFTVFFRQRYWLYSISPNLWRMLPSSDNRSCCLDFCNCYNLNIECLTSYLICNSDARDRTMTYGNGFQNPNRVARLLLLPLLFYISVSCRGV
jgi:hypothetical protein